jgi:eukaryotic-like serine/threonine-protein kinase
VGTYLGLWEEGCLDHRHEVAARAREACRSLRHYARVLPLGSPIARLFIGRAAWMLKKPKAAMRAWHSAIRVARGLKMPYEEGLAHLEIARRLAPDHPERPVHHARACEIFAAVGARFDLARAGQLSPEAAPPPIFLPAQDAEAKLTAGKL